MIEKPTPLPIVAEPRRWDRLIPLALILGVAVGLRVYHLNHWSLWYDEVVTVRLAQAASPGALLGQIQRTDATRAPLYPLVLMGWNRLVGSSDLANRALGAILGLATVGLVYGLGRTALDERTGRYAAWFCAVCPTLVTYSQEVRMYALLVPLAVASWWVFLSFRLRAGWGRVIGAAALLAALIYCHPVGLFLVAAQGLAFLVLLLLQARLALTWRRWIVLQTVVVLAVLPWISHYFDHRPEYLLPRYPIRFLLSVPIEYIGGNSLTLIPLGVLIGAGLLARSGRVVRLRDPVAGPVLLIWFALPPTFLYGYSLVGYPIFGPARLHLFVAPAYLLLVGHGVATLPGWGRAGVLAVTLPLTGYGLAAQTYAPGVKADYRTLARALRERGDERATITLHVRDRQYPYTQLEAARYYLEPPATVLLDTSDSPPQPVAPPEGRPAYLVDFVGPQSPPTTTTTGAEPTFFGLKVQRVAR